MRLASVTVIIMAAMIAATAASWADEPGPGSTPGHTPGQTGCPQVPGQTGPGHTGPGHTGPGHTGPGHTGPGQTPGQTGCPNTPGHRRRPVVRHLKITPKRFRAASDGRASVARSGGARITYVVSEAGTARFTIERCIATSRHPRRYCERRVRLRGAFRQGAVRGRNTLHFTGWLRGRRLAPGRYVLVLRVVDLTGDRSRGTRTPFRIIG